MLGLEFTPSTIIVALVVVVLMYFALRRLWRNGMCDCRKDEGGQGCSCDGCSGCHTVVRMLADMNDAAKMRR